LPAADYYFVNRTNGQGGAGLETLPTYSYTGTTENNLVANFATNGAHVAPIEPTPENPLYYHIFSASNGTILWFNKYRNPGAMCLLSNINGDDIIRGAPTSTDERDLWVIIKTGTV